MAAEYHDIKAEICYLTTAEGGRQTGVMSGYRGQFHYGGDDQPWDGFQHFPEFSDGVVIELGTLVRAKVRFLQSRWDEVHSKRIEVGVPFEIREGRRIVGRGVVTGAD